MTRKTAAFLAALLCTGGMSVSAYAGPWRSSVDLDPGESTTVRLTEQPKRIVYTVSNGKIFSYEPRSGKLTAKAPGTATLTANYEGRTYKCTITVSGETEEGTARPASSKIDGAKLLKVKQGDTVTLTLDTQGKNAYVRLANSTIAQISCGTTKNGKFPLYISGRLPGDGAITVCEYGTDDVIYAVNLRVYRDAEDAEIIEAELDPTLDYAEQVIVLVNRERAARGLPALEYDEELAEAAQVRVGELKSKFSHTRPNGKSVKSLLDGSGTHIGENIARKYKTPADAMKGWMASSRHRKNILSESYTKIGVAYDPSSNCWIQVFSD